jgi:hypothetical protein
MTLLDRIEAIARQHPPSELPFREALLGSLDGDLSSFRGCSSHYVRALDASISLNWFSFR